MPDYVEASCTTSTIRFPVPYAYKSLISSSIGSQNFVLYGRAQVEQHFFVDARRINNTDRTVPAANHLLDIGVLAVL